MHLLKYYRKDALLDGPITLNEMKYLLNKVKLNKAPGEDRVSYEVLCSSITNL